jgi:hypothetical protein
VSGRLHRVEAVVDALTFDLKSGPSWALIPIIDHRLLQAFPGGKYMAHAQKTRLIGYMERLHSPKSSRGTSCGQTMDGVR